MSHTDSKKTCEVLIIGGGPAGISAAVELCRRGFSSEDILVLEKGPAHSYSIQKFYTEGKRVDTDYRNEKAPCEGAMCLLPGNRESALSTIEFFIHYYRLRVLCGEGAEKIIKTGDQFFAETGQSEFFSRFVVVSIGILGKPNKPDYPLSSELKNQIHFDITSQPIENSEVLVVGGGNTAAEYVHYLANHNRVTLSYRKREFARLNEMNEETLKKMAKEGRADLLLGTNISAIAKAGAKIRVEFKETAPRLFDRIVYAIGGTSPEAFLRTAGVEYEAKQPKFNERFETNVKGLFLGGDLVFPKGTIIKAFNSGKVIAEEIGKRREEIGGRR
ncbi:MAG: NAD(P)-binding domain-containing protein [Candidatus Omnitrophica bacterium]|nr:NAD(P)-binding domain-containing protein [Candidatus Omnitrophota bacterium]